TYWLTSSRSPACWAGDSSRWPWSTCMTNGSRPSNDASPRAMAGAVMFSISTVWVLVYWSGLAMSPACWLGDSSRCPWSTCITNGLAMAAATVWPEQVDEGAGADADDADDDADDAEVADGVVERAITVGA